MKALNFLGAAVLLSALSLALGCQKETVFSSDQEPGSATALKAASQHKPETRAYRDSFVVVLGFYPDFAGGWTPADPDAPTWYPAEGKGNATHMGNANVYFNTHTLRVAGTVTVFDAPVGMFYGPQVEQFGISPTDEVTLVTYDGKGNSVWFRLKEKETGMPTWHLDATNIAMEGQMLIVGGSGKFEGATGETTFHGTFDQASLTKENGKWIFKTCSIWQNGWIRY